MSAVSNSVIPTSMAASTTAWVCSSSMRAPNALHPTPTVLTMRPERPSGRYVMSEGLAMIDSLVVPAGLGVHQRVVPAVDEVQHHPDGEPHREPEPGDRLQERDEPDAEGDPDGRHD